MKTSWITKSAFSSYYTNRKSIQSTACLHNNYTLRSKMHRSWLYKHPSKLWITSTERSIRRSTLVVPSDATLCRSNPQFEWVLHRACELPGEWVISYRCLACGWSKSTLSFSSISKLHINGSYLSSGCTQRAIGRNSHSVQMASVTVMVCLKFAVGQIPDLQQTESSTESVRECGKGEITYFD